MIDQLPRLAIISDVRVERTQGGQLLLYRLLTTYPADRLLVVQPQHISDAGLEIRLPGVEYRRLSYSIPRLFRSRYNPFSPLMSWAGMRCYQHSVNKSLHGFVPEAILTVVHGFLCFSAASVARLLGVPLYLILHDDWPNMMSYNRPRTLRPVLKAVSRAILGHVYRQAADRFCISPGMADQYEDMFGVRGQVLYPNRGEDSPIPKVRVGRAAGLGKIVVAHIGSTCGSPDVLRSLAEILSELGGHLDLYTQTSSDSLAEDGLIPPTVRRLGFLPPAELAERIADTAHVLFLPASFHPDKRAEVSTLFPSKMADYTAIGLPILTWGPTYSSAIRWALENPSAAVSYTRPEPGPIRAGLLRIINNPAEAVALASAAIEAGNRYFGLYQARTMLLDSLRQRKRFTCNKEFA